MISVGIGTFVCDWMFSIGMYVVYGLVMFVSR